MNNHDAIILKTIYSSIRPKAKYLTNINKYPNKEIFLWTIHNKREEKLVLDKFSNTNYYLIKDSYSSFTSM